MGKTKIQFRLRLKELLAERNISQKEFAKMTSMREATISELINDARISYNKKYIATCMEALGLTDISQIVQTIVSEYKE